MKPHGPRQFHPDATCHLIKFFQNVIVLRIKIYLFSKIDRIDANQWITWTRLIFWTRTAGAKCRIRLVFRRLTPAFSSTLKENQREGRNELYRNKKEGKNTLEWHVCWGSFRRRLSMMAFGDERRVRHSWGENSKSLFGKVVDLVALLFIRYTKLPHTTSLVVGIWRSLYQPMRSRFANDMAAELNFPKHP